MLDLVFLLLSAYALGLFALVYGLSVVAAGQVYLSLFSRQPIRGPAARALGWVCVGAAIAYFAVITWAWSIYDR